MFKETMLISLITVLFATVLAFALLIERALEVLKSLYDVIDSKYDLNRFWTRRAYATQQYMEKRLRVFQYVDAANSAAVFNRFNEMLLGPGDGYKGTVPTLSGDLVRAVWVRLACKIVGVAMGIYLALVFKLDMIAAAHAFDPTPMQLSTRGLLVTGVAMGLGAGPVHKLIRVLEKKRAANVPQVVTNA